MGGLALLVSPVLAVLGLILFIRMFARTARRGVVIDAAACIILWGIGAYAIGYVAAFSAEPFKESPLVVGLQYGIGVFLIGALPIAGLAAWLYRRLGGTTRQLVSAGIEIPVMQNPTREQK